MSTFYRVLKDTPAWDAGAILKRIGDNYQTISDLWGTKAADECENYYESYHIVEGAPDWYERVYEVSVLGKAKYLSREAAKKAHDTLYRER